VGRLPGVREQGGEPKGAPFSGTADRAHWAQAGISGDGSAQVSVWAVRQTVRGLPPFAPAYVTYTDRLESFIEGLRSLMTVADLAALTGLSWDTVKHMVKASLEREYGKPRLKELQYLSIDEIYLGRQQKYYTLVIDLATGRIVWVAQGRGGQSLRKFWRALRLSKAKIQAVAMDMSAAYWAAVAENLPDAAVVFDRFHIVKLVNEKLDDLRRELVREATGMMQKTVKGIRYLLLMRRENVQEEKLPRLDEALKHNEPLFLGYLLKEALGLLWDQPSLAKMKAFLKEWCGWANQTGVRQMQQLAKSLLLHAQGILNWWDHRINNGRMEGINNKIKTLLRQTYGLRDQRFFELKLYSLHHSRLELLG
jgi:transposase